MGRVYHESSLGQKPGDHLDPSYPLCIPRCYKDVLKMSVRWGFPGTFYYLYKGVWNLYLYGLMGDGDSDGVKSPAG